MKTTQTAGRITLAAAIAATLFGLTGCVTYVDRRPPPPVVEAPPPPPPPVYEEPATVEIVIRDERDFYDPLSPYGRWEYIGSYGRCWIPARVDRDWRPYSEGHWERTDAGWYWVSDEPWGWATYHYGRWDFDVRLGWFWVPQTLWAPAWVTWHRGAGYIGWSPLPPSARVAHSGVIEVDTHKIHRRGYVFVEERRFLEPVRPTTVVNNTTIINKTVNITNVKVVNNTVINEGPQTQVVEQVSGRKLHPVAARELRRKNEAPVAAAHRAGPRDREVERTPAAQSNKPVQTPPPAAPVTVATPTPPSQAEKEAQRKADEQQRREQMEAERRAKEQQRKAEQEAEQARKESERQAKMEAERKAQAERARVETERRNAEAQRKAQLEEERKAQAQAEQRAREQARMAKAEEARQKQEAEIRAREQAKQEAQQKQAQMAEARRKQELDRKAQAEADRRAREAQKVKGKKAATAKTSHGTNAPAPVTNAPAPPQQ